MIEQNDPTGTTVHDHLRATISTGPALDSGPFGGPFEPVVDFQHPASRKGESDLVALLGPSGCGKTTTLRMINRLIEPTSGTIQINGANVAEHRADHQLRSFSRRTAATYLPSRRTQRIDHHRRPGRLEYRDRHRIA